MGGLYAFADEILNQGQNEDPGIFSSNSNKLSERDKVKIAMGMESPTKSSLKYYDPLNPPSTSSPSVATAPTLFLLDDCLKKMDNVRNRTKELREERKYKKNAGARAAAEKFRTGRNAFLTDEPGAGGKRAAGRAAEAAKAIKRATELAEEAKAMERARLMRRKSYAADHVSPNKTREAVENYRKDKELLEEAVRNKLKRDKEEAERAKTEPPPDFIARQAKKAEEEARKAAFGKGKSTREAMALGKAAYQNVKEKYRKQGLTGEQLLEEELEQEEAEVIMRKSTENMTKVPVLATDGIAGGRLGMKEKEADFKATKSWREFKEEVERWEGTGGRNEPEEVRDAMAEFLTEKYLCQRLDGLPKTITVTKVRKDIVRIVENFVAARGEEGTAGVEGGVPNMVEDEDSSDDDDDFDYVASTAKNVKLRLLMQKKKAKEKEKMVQQEQDNWKGYALGEDIRKQAFLKGKQLTQIEAKQAAEKHAQDEIDRFNWEKRAKRKGKQGTQATKKTFKSFEPWACGICGQKNEAKERNCSTCGRDKMHTINKQKEAAAAAAAKVKPKDEAEAEKFKEDAEKHKKVNDDYLKFIAMKNKTDDTIVERGQMAGEIEGLLASLRGTLGPLSDVVEAPPAITNDDWRVKEPKGRMDGQHVGDINLDTNIPLDVKRKNEREDWLRSVGAGGEFKPKEGVNATYGMTEREVNYKEAKKPFSY
ncbi:hypothetical protein TrLO_g9497 [Triparma laevis f. longispina]|uniref:RanBP2-type domain-containing protein n=1 Tax=Triparma laevis f. longispina TaxID=1714387 RepID=A0A9W6ZFT1_9STRA|nr:hypothetical protein TrLO_g9497 [Triparma laevis f. longispina]